MPVGQINLFSPESQTKKLRTRAYISGVAATLRTLSADEIDACFEGFGHMFDVANHVHDWNLVFVELLHDIFRRNADSLCVCACQ